MAQSVQGLGYGWTTEDSGFEHLQKQEIFLLSIRSRQTLRPTLRVVYSGYGAVWLGVNRGRGVKRERA
jgi:hypothetical protein